MKGYKKRYQKLLHHHLTKNNQLSEEEFKALTSLTESEVECWLSLPKMTIKKHLFSCGSVLEYQKQRAELEARNLISLRHRLGQDVYLWSDTVGFRNIQPMQSTLLSGLLLVSGYNRKQALIWAMVMGLTIPDCTLDMRYPHRLPGLMQRLIGFSASQFSGDVISGNNKGK